MLHPWKRTAAEADAVFLRLSASNMARSPRREEGEGEGGKIVKEKSFWDLSSATEFQLYLFYLCCLPPHFVNELLALIVSSL